MIKIQFAEKSHIPALQEIERAAASIFNSVDLPEHLRSETISYQDHLNAQQNGLALVAFENQSTPVGYANMQKMGLYFHLLQIDVHPRVQRQGIGTALLNAVFDLAVKHGFEYVTLTTFRHIPWNAPWYAKHGFRILNISETPPLLLKILEEEKEKGLDNRVVMCKDIKDNQ